jgi:hypothetical protein
MVALGPPKCEQDDDAACLRRAGRDQARAGAAEDAEEDESSAESKWLPTNFLATN